jgi:outer membrane protein assembly factor BamB
MKHLLSLMLLITCISTGIFSQVQNSYHTGNKYSFLCSDYTGGKICVVDTTGKIIWEYPAKNSNDVWMLNNGNILFNDGNTVKEVTRDKKLVFEYKSESEIYACQRLPDGNTFVGECNKGRLLEVSPEGRIVKSIALLQEGTDGGGLFMRNARKLSNGHYLVALYGEGLVKEYDENGKVVKEFDAPGGPHSAIRLPDGNTLISCADKKNNPKIIELDTNGSLVWELTNNDVPDTWLKFMSGLERLPNGNTVITNWLGHNNFGKAPHVIEVNPKKEVLWIYNDTVQFKTISSIQILNIDNALGFDVLR